jgi:hypothetical protein
MQKGFEMLKITGKYREISDWDLIFYYEQSVIEYYKHYNKEIKLNYIKKLEDLREEVLKRMGW